MSAEKKKRSGCLIAMIVAGGVVLVGVIVLAVVVYSSPQGKALVALQEESARARARPGAQALREQGCRDAIVFPTRLLEKTLGKYVDGGVLLTAADDPALLEVNCIGAPAARTCEELARAFVLAEPSLEGPFHLVASDDDELPQCTGYFDAKGVSMGKSIVR